jgi:hypothetical protein
MTQTFSINGKTIELFVSGEGFSSAGLPVFIVSKVAGSPFTFSVLKSAAI